ncbi:hypothetical protein [Caulobacter radicis]|uniref:hypothetical protein n=1 Tax=Caulobacter radicis TaxID=2172650 RepID=UPI0010580B2B|nr:hypothetical protein [Caulobacter radicis]
MALALAGAWAGTASAAPQPRACFAEWTAKGWFAMAHAHAWPDGRLDKVAVSVAPPPKGPVAERILPRLRYRATATAADGTPRAWALEADMVAWADDVGRGWTVELLADGARVGGGPVAWAPPNRLAGTEHLPIPEQSTGLYRTAEAGVLEAIDRAGRLEAVIRAKGRRPITLAFDDPGRARAQAVGEAAMDRLRRTAAGETLAGANCRALSEGR